MNRFLLLPQVTNAIEPHVIGDTADAVDAAIDSASRPANR
jgi:hypothetical protein